jgi:hypothetical protein
MSGDGLVRPLNAPPGVSPQPGVQPGVYNGVILADKVIVFGPGDGVFVYSGTPGPGNPPIAWVGAGLVDPYGNVLPSTTGVAGSGTFQAGDTVLDASGVFVYNGPPGANLLLLSICGAAGATDQFGNIAPQGLTTYSSTTPGQATNIGWGGIFAQLFNADGGGSQQGLWNIGGEFRFNGLGALTVIDGADGETYSTQRLSLFLPAGGGVPLTVTTPTMFFTSNVAVRSYRVSGMLLLTSNAAVSVSFEFAGTAAYTGEIAASIVRAAVLLGTNVIPPNALTGVGGAMLGGGDVYICYLDGTISVSAAGTMTVAGAVSANGAGVTVDPFSYLDVMPV